MQNPKRFSSLNPLRVMVVDDSAVIRGLFTRWINQETDIVLAGTATDGLSGLAKLGELDPDILILDIEMPNMGGLEALPKFLAIKPNLKIFMVSSLTSRGADVTLRALELGATDFIAKPEAGRIGGADTFRLELLTKIRGVFPSLPISGPISYETAKPAAPAPSLSGPVRFAQKSTPLPTQNSSQPTASPLLPPKASTSSPTVVSHGTHQAAHQTPKHSRTLPDTSPAQIVRPNFVKTTHPTARKPISSRKPEILLIGSSTGGPPALRQFLYALGPDWKLPILIVQHMPPAFTTIMAEHLNKALPQTVTEARNNEPVQSRHIYVAPGDYHMTLSEDTGTLSIKLDQGPPVNWCRPAVDPLFKSAAQIYGPSALGVILTGMGADGRSGAGDIKSNGGIIMVQDEESSVVWGMPGAVAEAGFADAIRPIPALSEACRALARGERL